MNCRICSGTSLTLVLDLGYQPWCNHFLTKDEVGKEPTYPLRLVYCNDCSLVQLDYTVAKEVMFGNHTYLSGITKSLSAHFAQVAHDIDQEFFAHSPQKSVLDIGSNDGTQLKHFQALKYDVLGVESSKMTADIAKDQGVPTVNRFFNLDLVRELDRKFDVINAAGVFFHLEELHSVTAGIKEALKDDGVFIVQFLYMPSIVQNLAFDQIYHEHLLYYTLTTLRKLLNRHGLDLFDARLAPIHGGSMIAYVTHTGKRPETASLKDWLKKEDKWQCNSLAYYQEFARNVEKLKGDTVRFLEGAKKSGKRIYGMGAPVKGNTMLNYFNVGTETIDCLLEKNELRRDLFSPGKHIPIRIEGEVDEQPDIYFVLAWNFKKEILARNQDLIARGIEFYFPVNPKEDAV